MSVKVMCEPVSTGAQNEVGTFTTVEEAVRATAIDVRNYRSIIYTFNCSGRAMFRSGVNLYIFKEVVRKSKARRRAV